MMDNVTGTNGMDQKFAALKVKFAGYIFQISKNCANRDRINDHEDIKSVLENVLWECVKKYPTIDDLELLKVFKVSVSHELATLMSSKRIEKSDYTKMISIEGFRERSSKRGRKDGGFEAALSIEGKDVTDRDYEMGINDVLANVSPESAMVIMDIMRPENRGKFIKGSKKAFGEVKKYLQG